MLTSRFRANRFARLLALLGCIPAIGLSQTPPDAASGVAAATVPAHDGLHDFDYLVGSWKIHLKKRLRPLTGSNEWVEFDGTVVCRKVWGGRAELEEFDVSSPQQHIEIHGMAMRLYDPASHLWRIYWSDTHSNAFDGPPMVGEFRNGRGEFFDQEVRDGRPILARFTWTNTTTKAPHFEQAYSNDWGKTWETNWITEQTKVAP